MKDKLNGNELDWDFSVEGITPDDADELLHRIREGFLEKVAGADWGLKPIGFDEFAKLRIYICGLERMLFANSKETK